MIISCPKCGRRLTAEPRLFGHLLGCPFCQARFTMTSLPRGTRPSAWQSILSGFLAPFSIAAKFAKRCCNGLTSASEGVLAAPRLPSYGDSGENGSGDGSSRERQYYDSHGKYVGYRDEDGWVHAEGGRNYIGRIDDDGSFYDGSGMYRGQVDSHGGSGYTWEDREGYTGFQDGSSFSENEHVGIPDIYEEGGEGTGGAFDALLDDVDDNANDDVDDDADDDDVEW